ncbi:MAG: YtxH domain-containing protein [Candidatus Eremiobacterota bacterium]
MATEPEAVPEAESQEKPNVLAAFSLGLLVGTLVGAASAILLAPQPGTETRAELTEKARKLQDRASGLAHEVRGGLEKLTHKIRPSAGPDVTETLKEEGDRLSPDGVRIL